MMEDDEWSRDRTLSGKLKLGNWPEQLAPPLICHLRGWHFSCYAPDPVTSTATSPHAHGDVVDVRIATTRLERTLMRCDVCLSMRFACEPSEVKLWLPRDCDDSRADRSRWLAAFECLRPPEAPPPPPIDDAAGEGQETEDRRRSTANTVAYVREIYLALRLKGSIEVDRAVSAHTYGVSCEVDVDDGADRHGGVHEFPSAARVDAPTRHMVRTLVDKLLAEAEDAPAWATISRGYEFEFAPLWGSLVRTGHSMRLSASCASLRAARARGIAALPSE
jgi:hypothetical protein